MFKSDSKEINGTRIIRILFCQKPTNKSKTEKTFPLIKMTLILLKSYPTKDRTSDFCTPWLLIVFEIVVKWT
jgi:hypothetical protein